MVFIISMDEWVSQYGLEKAGNIIFGRALYSS